ncbi:hypothetical protein QBC35DRAFT_481176 [Podospora australis]|uniref:Uncharacterized protein n=1 Tax=Podospora australis TaxID=1536484 RepID=A0AAN6X3R6_9PEZI|nr:hypothetical protein QBC35DRAFT_481176 [Podospora australis]
MILFETTESVIEVLWDVALAFFVVRLAFIYALLTFGTTALLSYVLLPQLQFANGSAHFAPQVLLNLAASVMWARYTVAKYEIPRVVGFRLAIGVLAAVLVLGMEGVLGLMEAGEWKAVGILTASMPVLVMGFEKRGESEVILGQGGFEEKRIGG